MVARILTVTELLQNDIMVARILTVTEILQNDIMVVRILTVTEILQNDRSERVLDGRNVMDSGLCQNDRRGNGIIRPVNMLIREIQIATSSQ